MHPNLRPNNYEGVSGGGGVDIYIKHHVLGIFRMNLMPDNMKLLWIEISTGTYQFLMGVCYRPPNQPVSFWKIYKKTMT